MPNGLILELSTLPARHPPIGAALLRGYAPAVIVRLGIDPTPQPSSTMVRRVDVDWIARPGTRPLVQVSRDIGWSDLGHLLDTVCRQWAQAYDALTVTEQAAIGVMALLIHDLEGAVLQSVLPIGSGGDYLVLHPKARNPIQVEVSGIREAAGSGSRSRLAEKSEQVLTKCEVGFASVTTFSHPSRPVVHSFLHYVSRGRKKVGKKGKKK